MKAKRTALLILCVIVAIQAIGSLAFWWMGTFNDNLASLMSWPNIDVILLFIFTLLLYLFNSRIIAVLLLIYTSDGLLLLWILKGATTGDFMPPATALLIAIIAVQLTIVIFKTHALQETTALKTPRPTWVIPALLVAFASVAAAFFIPIIAG